MFITGHTVPAGHDAARAAARSRLTLHAGIGRKRIVIVETEVDATPDALEPHPGLATLQPPIGLAVHYGSLQVEQLIIADH